ncbi:type II secretion system F family protein [Gracilimonas tropica]|uniref:type II secretion system F family protein n=1 Tax=Gracilimonas tropica TaxID=454600 RepID=UPI00036A75FE|nr:type II secretion system F family protein [Gracilimonas tropica]
MAKYPASIEKQLSGKSSDKSLLKKDIDIPFISRIPEKEIIDFTRNLGVMLKARLPLMKALETAEAQTSHTKFKEIVSGVRKSVKKGNSLAKSFEKHPRVFDDIYRQLTKVGEVSGTLDEVMLRLSSYREKAYKLKQRIRMALAYPGMIIGVAIAAVSFLLIFVVPTFVDMYQDFQAELPVPTQLILAVSNFLTNNGIGIGIGLILIGIGINYGIKTQKGRTFVDRLLFRIPYFGDLYTKSLVSQFTKTLSTLLHSGVTLSDALNILKGSSNNLILQKEVGIMSSSIRKGKSFKQSLSGSVIFPEMVIQMINVGEETANLDEMLSQVADLYEEETDIMVEGLTSVIEPFLIVFIGLIVGGIIVALYLPIFELVNVIG